MSRLPLPTLAALAFVALPLSAHAQRSIGLHARTAGELAAMCSVNPHEPAAEAKINYCHGFAQGVVDVELMHGKPFCWPSPPPSRDATLEQFVRWVRAQPDRARENPVIGLMQFLRDRYPCR
jgi:hypothetical protein